MLAPIWGYAPLLDIDDATYARQQLARASVMARLCGTIRTGHLPAGGPAAKIIDECSTVTAFHDALAGRARPQTRGH